ncbi:hypothetical protein K3495_g1150 [Podosphaera aphanis]|nr:hypothetical protein K3495_g1150 [Podosphaera aphanis]
MSLQEALDWGQAEGITFDPAKLELQHFSRRRAEKTQGRLPPYHTGIYPYQKTQLAPTPNGLGFTWTKISPLNGMSSP